MNSFQDKVSVVIPVYNSARYLKCSLDSVLTQTYTNIEIIVVDDGSIDNSPSILKQYDDRIIVLSQENHGLASALNLAVKKMTGKWLKWFSPDDILYPNAIETLVSNAKKLPINTIVYSNWELIDGKNKTLHKFSESNYNDLKIFDFNIRLLVGQQINVNTTIIPIFLFDSGCTFRNLEDPVAIDYDFFLRAGILYNTKFHLVDNILLKYRIHKNQLSHRNISKTLSFVSVLRNEILSGLEESVKKKYLLALQEYEKGKPLSERTFELGLKFTKKLPAWMSDRLIVFYLNRIRRVRK